MKHSTVRFALVTCFIGALAVPAFSQSSSPSWRDRVRVAAAAAAAQRSHRVANTPRPAPARTPVVAPRAARPSTTITSVSAVPSSRPRPVVRRTARTRPSYVRTNLFVGGELANLRHRPVIIGNRTYVPLRDFVGYINRRFQTRLSVEWASGDVILRENGSGRMARTTRTASAESGMATALLHLWHGDVTTAARFAQRAADAGDADAQELLDWIAESGGDDVGVVRVTNATATPDVEIFLDGEPLDTDGMVALVKSGTHTVRIGETERTIAVTPGKAFVIKVAERPS